MNILTEVRVLKSSQLFAVLFSVWFPRLYPWHSFLSEQIPDAVFPPVCRSLSEPVPCQALIMCFHCGCTCCCLVAGDEKLHIYCMILWQTSNSINTTFYLTVLCRRFQHGLAQHERPNPCWKKVEKELHTMIRNIILCFDHNTVKVCAEMLLEQGSDSPYSQCYSLSFFFNDVRVVLICYMMWFGDVSVLPPEREFCEICVCYLLCVSYEC